MVSEDGRLSFRMTGFFSVALACTSVNDLPGYCYSNDGPYFCLPLRLVGERSDDPRDCATGFNSFFPDEESTVCVETSNDDVRVPTPCLIPFNYYDPIDVVASPGCLEGFCVRKSATEALCADRDDLCIDRCSFYFCLCFKKSLTVRSNYVFFAVPGASCQLIDGTPGYCSFQLERNLCVGLHATGDVCDDDTQCSSGHCINAGSGEGVRYICCSSACEGSVCVDGCNDNGDGCKIAPFDFGYYQYDCNGECSTTYVSYCDVGFCDGVSTECQPPTKVLNEECEIDGQCISGYCSDGICAASFGKVETSSLCVSNLLTAPPLPGDESVVRGCDGASVQQSPFGVCLFGDKQVAACARNCASTQSTGDECAIAGYDAGGYCDAQHPTQCAPKRVAGARCEFDYECVSEQCDGDTAFDKFCLPTAAASLVIGEPCASRFQCFSDRCSDAYCSGDAQSCVKRCVEQASGSHLCIDKFVSGDVLTRKFAEPACLSGFCTKQSQASCAAPCPDDSALGGNKKSAKRRLFMLF